MSLAQLKALEDTTKLQINRADDNNRPALFSRVQAWLKVREMVEKTEAKQAPKKKNAIRSGNSGHARVGLALPLVELQGHQGIEADDDDDDMKQTVIMESSASDPPPADQQLPIPAGHELKLQAAEQIWNAPT
jgi:hypothetical protein